MNRQFVFAAFFVATVASLPLHGQPSDTELGKQVLAKYGDAIFQRIKQSPELIRFVDGLPAGKIDQKMQELSQKAVQVASALPDEMLQVRHEAMLAILEQAPAPACAQIYRGGKNAADGDAAVNRALLANPKLARVWFQFIFDAHMAALRDAKPRDVSASEFETSVDVMRSAMSERDSRRFDDARQKLDEITDAEACWTGRMHYRYALRVKSKDDRSILMRGLLP